MFFYTPLLLLYLLFACLLYFTCLYIVRNDENKDVQSFNVSFYPWNWCPALNISFGLNLTWSGLFSCSDMPKMTTCGNFTNIM